MFGRISKKIGLTETELKIVLFLVISFLIGISYKTFFKSDSESEYKVFNYEEEDQKFYASDDKKNISDSVKSDNKEVDYKQEVLNFNERSFKNVQKKEVLTEKSLNLNTAKLNELVNLPGIGEKTAQKILEYRQQHKRFKNVNELLNVKGIGESKLEKIKKYIYID